MEISDSSTGEKLMAEGDSGIPLVVTILSALLKRRVEENDSLQYCHSDPQSICAQAAFAGLDNLKMPIDKYLQHIFSGINCSPSCYLVALIYIDRFTDLFPCVLVDSSNVHGLMLASLLAAIKMFNIRCGPINNYVAAVGGVSLPELNELETEFCFAMNFDLFVTRETYNAYCSMLEEEMKSLLPTKKRKRSPSDCHQLPRSKK